ncbi:MAG: hypothetical protein M0R66_05770 [Candidatus Omnitrophica bacterium]|nr:hypothetical protein [Candidatus Omnitrophota bacterium]
MEKLRYEFDPYNRLTVKSKALRGARRFLEGQFKISEHNTLTYQIKTSVPYDIKAPHQVKLEGSWSLTKDHELRLTLDKLGRETFGDQVTLQGEVIDARKNSLLFAVTTKAKDYAPSVYILELVGSWQADEHNRLTFRVDKERGSTDSLTFDGIWQIDKNYQITYSYQKEHLVRKNKETHTLAFEGHWDIRDKARLTYIIDTNTDSGFDFNTSIGIFKGDYIKYELGIGLSRKAQPVKKTVTFFGKWRMKKAIGLVFEVEQEERKIQAFAFGAEVRLTDKSSIVFNLRNSLNKEIGARLELSRDIFSGDGQAFLRLLGSKQETAILAGAGWRW